jgi:uncharacterized protein (DUF433 family)
VVLWKATAAVTGTGPMLDWSQCPAVERSPDRVSGAWVFRGTRVPVAALFENLESGARVEEFLEWFPGVSREQAEAVPEHTGPGGYGSEKDRGRPSSPKAGPPRR